MTENRAEKPLFGTLNLRKFIDEEKRAQLLLEVLKKENRYREDLLYTGVHDIPWSILKKHGTDHPDRTKTFCHEEADLVSPSGGNNIFVHAEAGNDSAVLVYDGRYLTEYIPYEYEIDKGLTFKDILIAAIKLKF